MNLKNKKVWLLSALSFVLGAGFSAGVFYYKGQFNVSSFERQAQNEALSETDDYKIQTQMKVSERTPQSKIGTLRKLVVIEYKDFSKIKNYRETNFKRRTISNNSLIQRNFDELNFEGSLLINNDMSGSSFKKALFNKARLIWPPRGAAYDDSFAFMWPNPLKGSEFYRAHFQDALIRVPDIKDVSFREARMQGVIIDVLPPKIEKVFETHGRVSFRLEGYPNDPFFWNIRETFHGDTRYVIPRGKSYYEDSEYLEWSKRNWGNNTVNSNTDFRGALLLRADLSTLEDLHLAQLDGAWYNNQTIFPDGFNPKAHGMLHGDSY